jgi:anti-sigma B factor antagonist
MGFQLGTREIGRVIVVEAVGRFTLADGQTKLRDLIHVFTGYGARKFVLTLARVEVIDSYGVGELVRSYSVVRQMGGEIKLAGVNQKVLDVLSVCRLNTFFEICLGGGGRPSGIQARCSIDLWHAHAMASDGLENRQKVGDCQEVADLFVQVNQIEIAAFVPGGKVQPDYGSQA